MKLQDLKSKYDSLSTKKNLTGKEALAAVEQDGFALRYVQMQTEEICLAAVKQKGYALRYVQMQTEEICLAAVKQSGYALAYVQMQTEEICLAAVKQDGYVLEYVQENMFKQEPIELTLEEIASRFNIDVNLLKIIK